MEKIPGAPSKTFGNRDFNFLESIDFLKNLWTYTSLRANCYTIVLMAGDNIRYRHFCLEDLGDYHSLFKEVGKYLEKAKPGDHIYYQVLPLSKKPEKGRGSSRDVEIGRWLWCDLDYKQVVDSGAGFSGCKEIEDHAIDCYYQDGDKWIHVLRPPLSEVLKTVEENLGIRPTIVVDSGAGYHLYFKLAYEIEARKLAGLEAKIVDLLGGDPQSKDLARILRLPGSINPRVGRPARVIYYEPGIEIDPEVIEAIEEKQAEKVEAQALEFRDLSDTQILKIVDLLKNSYRPGYRQLLLLYLAGWLAKAKISPLTAVKIAKHLYESTQDSDPLKSRLGAIIYSYKKAGIDLGPYAQAIEEIAGVKPYGLEREIREEEVKGKTGLQEILEATVGEEGGLGIINELTEIIGTLSPYRDSIIELLDYEKQIYAIANLRAQVIARAKRENNGFTYKERVVLAAPTKITVYDSPIGGVRKYEIVFEGPTLRRPLVIGPAMIEEIADRLRAEGLVYHSRLLNDVLNAIVNAYIKKGRAEIKAEIESPGFYSIDGNIISVKYETREIDKEKLKEALLLLNELGENWFKHAKEKFAQVIKWGAIAPFTYILKARGHRQKYLFLSGDSGTGKTTLGKIILKIWGLDSRFEKTGASIDTPARLGYVLSQSTFPILINEPGGALMKEEIVEMIKNASDGLTARGKYVKGNYVEYPALAPLIFTSNRPLPRDDALLNRFIIISFSYGDKIPQERQALFKEAVEPKLGILSEIGNCISTQVLNGAKIDPQSLLSKCYEIAGLEPPAWIHLEYLEEMPETQVLEEFTERFKKLINDLYARYVSRVIQVEIDTYRSESITPDKLTLVEKIRTLLEKNMIPGAIAKNNRVMILSPLLDEIGLSNRVGLKSLAEMLGWDYKTVKISGRPYKSIETDLERLISLFEAPE